MYKLYKFIIVQYLLVYSYITLWLSFKWYTQLSVFILYFFFLLWNLNKILIILFPNFYVIFFSSFFNFFSLSLWTIINLYIYKKKLLFLIRIAYNYNICFVGCCFGYKEDMWFYSGIIKKFKEAWRRNT